MILKEKFNTVDLVRVALFCAFIAVCSFVSIPIGAVPITLQLFGVYFALYAGGGGKGAMSVLLYVLLGVVGLPVFSGFCGGVSRLFDTTGGFIWGFLLLSIVYLAVEKLLSGVKYNRIIATVVSLLVFYACGSVWYCMVYLADFGSMGTALAVTVFPFIAFDAVKIFLALAVAKRLRKFLHIT